MSCPKTKRRIAVFAGLLGLGLVLIAVAELVLQPEVIDPVPKLVFQEQEDPWHPTLAFQDAAGAAVQLADFEGELVLLNIWATWCVPCVKELPALDRLQQKLSDQPFRVVPVSVDRQKTTAALSRFYEKHDIRALPLYIESERAVSKSLNIRGLPVSYLISPAGRVLGRVDGDVLWDHPEAGLALIKSHLGF